MDMQGENVADNDRYAFLLGSALRNGDSEQFFCIYDSIIPKDLPEIQLDNIKETARYISELPEDTFNELVVNARDFSLARGRPAQPPPPPLAMTSRGQHATTQHSQEEEEAHSLPSSPTKVPPLDFHSVAANKGSAAAMTDDDSGLPSSTKTGRRTSFSSEDMADDERPKQATAASSKSRGVAAGSKGEGDGKEEKVLVVSRMMHNPHYDEEVWVENDDDESVDSPRSDASDSQNYDFPHPQMAAQTTENATEMTTFRSREGKFYRDDEDDEDDDESDNDGNIHRRLYCHSRDLPRVPDLSAMSLKRSTKMLGSSSLRSALGDGGSYLDTGVDRSVHFSSLDGANGHGPSRYLPDGALSRSSHSPPFGTGEDTLDRVGHSLETLLPSSYNLSRAGVSSEGAMASADSKKRKKKKKDAKDESGREGVTSGKKSMTTDVNGNPLDPQVYRSMRETPRTHESSSFVSSSRGRDSIGTANHDFSGASRGDPFEMGNKSDEPTSPPSGGNGQGDKRKSKKNSRKPGKDVRPEDDPNYVGHVKDVDKLVEFINNTIGEKKLKKITGSTATGGSESSAAASAASTNKTQKKAKDKSKPSKQFVTTGVGENSDYSLAPASETTQLLSADTSYTPSYSSVGEHVAGGESKGTGISPDVQPLEVGMGSSSSREEPGAEAEAAPPADSVKEDKEQDKAEPAAVEPAPSKDSTATTPSTDAATVADMKVDSVKNHVLPAENKAVSSVSKKQQQIGEAKEPKEKGKGKSGGKDTKSESGGDSTSKKPKAKTPKNDMKPAVVPDKAQVSEVKKDGKTSTSASQDTVKTKDSKKNVSPAVSSPKTPSDIDFDASAFIFTDVDLPPKVTDTDFILVAKKKKRSPNPGGGFQGPSGQGSYSSSAGYYSSRDWQQQQQHSSPFPSVPYSKSSSQWESGTRPTFTPTTTPTTTTTTTTTPPSKPRSYTPPPFSRVNQSYPSSAKVRDLSPSAFPELTTPGRLGSVGNDGRRRSMEDIPTFDSGQLLTFDRDSDKESTKSLPADKSMGVVRGGCGYPVSYASMASSKTPRQSVDSSKAESVASSMEGGGASVDGYPSLSSPGSTAASTASMKWKGSPQERRHSIGSAPEELSRAAHPSASTNLQRSGSQEMLPRESADTAATESKVDVATLLELDSQGTGQSSSAVSCVSSDVDSARGSEAGSETPGERDVASVPAEARKTVSPPVSSTSSIPVSSESSACRTVAGSQGQVASTATSEARPKGAVSSSAPKPIAGVGIGAGATVPSKEAVVSKKLKVVTRPVNNGLNNKNNVVVFCNKLSEDCNLQDVSFGFAPLYGIGDKEGSEQATPAASGVDGAGNSAVPDQPAAKEAGGVASPSNPTQANASSASPSSSLPGAMDSANKPPKGPHIAGLNGLVSGRAAPADSASDRPEGAAANAPPAPQSARGTPLRVPKNGVVLTLGARIPDQKPTCTFFVPNAKDRPVAVDASYLQQAWNNLQSKMESDSSHTVVYKE